MHSTDDGKYNLEENSITDDENRPPVTSHASSRDYTKIKSHSCAVRHMYQEISVKKCRTKKNKPPPPVVQTSQAPIPMNREKIPEKQREKPKPEKLPEKHQLETTHEKLESEKSTTPTKTNDEEVINSWSKSSSVNRVYDGNNEIIILVEPPVYKRHNIWITPKPASTYRDDYLDSVPRPMSVKE